MEYLDLLKGVLTVSQWTALVIIIIGVMVLTQAFKKIYFGFYPSHSRKKSAAKIWLFALIVGIGGSYVGSIMGKPIQPDWFWVMCGTVSGGGAIGAFKLLIEIIWPKLKAKVIA